MGKTVVRFCAIALTTLLIVVSLGGLYPQGLRAEGNTISIAVAASLSGDAASGGQEIVDNIKLYIDATNRDGGINGRQLKLNVFDDKGNADGATQVANDIAKSDALVVLGHRSSDASIAAGNIYQDKKLPAITGTANNPKVTSDRPYYFRIIYTNPDLAKTLSI
jgi:branched-chain amino acid transport system substrate-binding protein